MIDVTFNGTDTVVSNVDQYDFGQRVRIHGLPSPQDFEEYDDFIPGQTEIILEVHYYLGTDSQAICYHAQWDEENDCWMVDSPDELLEQCEPIYMAVYVKFSELLRAKTYYHASFTPIHRASPSDRATQIQIKTWTELQEEINDAITEIDTAISNSNGQTALANAATESANNAAAYANNKGDYANNKGDYANAKGDYANEKGFYADQKGYYANQQGDYAKDEGDYAKEQGDYAKAQGLSAGMQMAEISDKLTRVHVSTTTGQPGTNASCVVQLKDDDAEASPPVEKGWYFAFTIPQGQTGAQGITPAITVAVDLVAPGTAPSVTKTGTDAAPTYTIHLPRVATFTLSGTTLYITTA